MNEELAKQVFSTIAGKVSKQILLKIYGMKCLRKEKQSCGKGSEWRLCRLLWYVV